MTIQRGRLVNLLKNHSNPNDTARNHANVTTPLRVTLDETKAKISNEIVKEAIEYILWNDLWNDKGVFGRNKDVMVGRYAQDRYSRGQKVFVNFGYNVGREASMPHPAIILKNFQQLAVVIPTTTDDGVNLGELEKLIIHCPSDGNVFPENDILEIHQIRCIGKNRIINDLEKNTKDYILPNTQIDMLNNTISDRLRTLGARGNIDERADANSRLQS